MNLIYPKEINFFEKEKNMLNYSLGDYFGNI